MTKLIAAFAPGEWRPSAVGSTRYHLYNLSRRGWLVIYFNPPQRVSTSLRVTDASGAAVEAPGKQGFLAVTLPWLVPFAVRATFDPKSGAVWREIASRRWVGAAKRFLGKINVSPDLYWFGSPWHGRMAALVGASVPRVTHVYDELSESPALKPWQREMLWSWERQLYGECDACLCSSRPQFERRAGLCTHTMLVQNAVSDAALAPLPRKIDSPLLDYMKSLPRPRIAYGGVADLRLDGELFTRVLLDIPESQIVFMGKRDDSFTEKFAGFTEDEPRVHHLGQVPYGLYPALYKEADVLVLAHKRMPFTDAMYPEKLNEYLASGKPIVCIGLPEVKRLASEALDPRLIRVADTPEEFVELVREALQDHDPVLAKARKRLASLHTWSVEAERLDKALGELIKN